jgi:hypothetical protein
VVRSAPTCATHSHAHDCEAEDVDDAAVEVLVLIEGPASEVDDKTRTAVRTYKVEREGAR